MCIQCVLVNIMKFQRINITLPEPLVKQSKILIKEGLFSNFSELVKTGIKDELRMDLPLIRKKKTLKKIFSDTKLSGADLSGLSKEEIVQKLRKTREHLWEKKYMDWFE